PFQRASVPVQPPFEAPRYDGPRVRGSAPRSANTIRPGRRLICSACDSSRSPENSLLSPRPFWLRLQPCPSRDRLAAICLSLRRLELRLPATLPPPRKRSHPN